MRAAFVWSSIVAVGATVAVVACTAAPGTSTGTTTTLREKLLAYTARSYAVAQKPHKVHLDTLVIDNDLKLSVTNFDADKGIRKSAGSLKTKAAGEEVEVLETVATCQSAVMDGKPHAIEMIEDRWPVMGDHDNQSTIEDKTTGHFLKVTFDQEFQKFTATMDGETLAIVTNPDGTYAVDGKPAKTEDEAAALIGASAVGHVSLQTLAAIYGTLLERRKFLMAGASPVMVAAVPQRQTLVAIDCTPGRGESGTPGDPTDLVRAVIALREKQP